jgi:hypothetical protein
LYINGGGGGIPMEFTEATGGELPGGKLMYPIIVFGGTEETAEGGKVFFFFFFFFS